MSKHNGVHKNNGKHNHNNGHSTCSAAVLDPPDPVPVTAALDGRGEPPDASHPPSPSNDSGLQDSGPRTPPLIPVQDSLLRDYLDGRTTLVDIAAIHDMPLSQVLAWLNRPEVQLEIQA